MSLKFGGEEEVQGSNLKVFEKEIQTNLREQF